MSTAVVSNRFYGVTTPMFGGPNWSKDGREIYVPGLPELPQGWHWIITEYDRSYRKYCIHLNASHDRNRVEYTNDKASIVQVAEKIVDKLQRIAEIYEMKDWGDLRGKDEVYNLKLPELPSGCKIEVHDLLENIVWVHVFAKNFEHTITIKRRSKKHVQNVINHIAHSAWKNDKK